MEKYLEVLNLLSEIAGDYDENVYSVHTYAFGYIPFKNGVNMVNEVGTKFSDIAHWLICEGEINFNNSLSKSCV